MVPRTSLNEAQAMVQRKEYHEAIAKLLLGKDKLTSPGKPDLGQASCDALLTSTYKTLTSDHYLALKVREWCWRDRADTFRRVSRVCQNLTYPPASLLAGCRDGDGERNQARLPQVVAQVPPGQVRW